MISQERSEAMEAARRIVAVAERLTKPRRPTVAELEAILQQPDGLPVHINPDGSIGARTNDSLIVARALLSTRAEAIEECAKACETVGADWLAAHELNKFYAAKYLAQHLRSLLSREIESEI